MSVEISTLPISTFNKFPYASSATKRAAEQGRDLGRTIYTDSNKFYKIWKTSSSVHRMIFVDGKPIEVNNKNADGQEVLLGLLCGLFDEKTCPALVDHIHQSGRLVGYITRAGAPVTPAELETGDGVEFINGITDRSLRSGFVLRDLHAGNVVRLDDGRLSLIDLETPLSHLYSLDIDAEITSGALRRGICAAYRRAIHDVFDVRSTTPRVLEMRRDLWRRVRPSLVPIGAGPSRDTRSGIALMEDYVESTGDGHFQADWAWIEGARKFLSEI
jgi:hypothetical protein